MVMMITTGLRIALIIYLGPRAMLHMCYVVLMYELQVPI